MNEFLLNAAGSVLGIIIGLLAAGGAVFLVELALKSIKWGQRAFGSTDFVHYGPGDDDVPF